MFGYLLVSNGANQKPSYQQLTSAMIGSGTISSGKFGTGTIINKDASASRVKLSIAPDSSDSNILVIKFGANV